MPKWILIFIYPLFSSAADIEYSCHFERPLPMLKKIKDTKQAINITEMKFVYSQNGFGGYLMKAFFISGNEKFVLDEKMNPVDLVDKGFNVTAKRNKATESCVQQAQQNFLKSSSAHRTQGEPTRNVAQTRNPAQEAIASIQVANENIKRPTDNYRNYGQLQNNEGKTCVGFNCNTNPKSVPVVQNNPIKQNR